MKKIYSLLAILWIANNSFAQFGVSANASSGSVCLGSSTTLTAIASPVSYIGSVIAYNPLPAEGINILCTGGALDAVDPISPAANPSGVLFLNNSRWDNITLPFDFTYFGNIYSQVNICTNGWIGLGATNAGLTGFNVSVPNTIAANNVIFGMLSNLTFQGSTGGTIEYFVDGNAPNQRFVVLFSGVHFTSGGGTGDVEIILYEGTNVIEIYNSVITNTTLNKTQGIENLTGSVGVAVPGKNNLGNWGGAASAYRFTPEQISYNWTPVTGLSSGSGQTVIATPAATTTYTITATNSSSTNAVNSVTVTVDPASGLLAGTPGGGSISHNIDVSSSGTYYRDISNCKLISYILPSGSSPVSNSINNTLKIDLGASKRGTSDLYVARKYDIEPIINPATSSALITLYYLQSEFNNFNVKASDSGHKALPNGPSDVAGINNLILRQCHGTGTNPLNYTGSWQDFTVSSPGTSINWNVSQNRWEIIIPVTGFSGFYLTSKKESPLPLKMEYFTGAQRDDYHLLTWKYTCTSVSAQFVLEKSIDGINYHPAYTIKVNQSQCQLPFNYTEKHPVGGMNYYRVKSIDVDGSFDYSNIVALEVKTKGFNLISVTPGLIRDETAVMKISSGTSRQINIVITDLSGRMVSSEKVMLQQGINMYFLPVARIARGAYQITGYTANERPQTLKFIKL